MRTGKQQSDSVFLAKMAHCYELSSTMRRFSKRENLLAVLKNILPRPLASPPAMRRRIALLWLIEDFYQDFPFLIGTRGRPPYTADMRWLVEKGYLRLERGRSGSGFERTSQLVMTPVGRQAVKKAAIREPDRSWMYGAMVHGVLA